MALASTAPGSAAPRSRPQTSKALIRADVVPVGYRVHSVAAWDADVDQFGLAGGGELRERDVAGGHPLRRRRSSSRARSARSRSAPFMAS